MLVFRNSYSLLANCPQAASKSFPRLASGIVKFKWQKQHNRLFKKVTHFAGGG